MTAVMTALRSFSWKSKQTTTGLLILFLFLIAYSLIMNLSYSYGDAIFDIPPEENEEVKQDWSLDHGRQPENGRFCELYNITKPYKTNFDCVKTKSVPVISACVYEIWRDNFISHDIKYTGLWEWHILGDLQSRLNQDPSMGFIDAGANIGFYSLITAKMGHQTVAVEPFLESVYRLHKGALLSEVEDNLIIVRNAIADVRVKGQVVASGDNQGDTRIILDYRPCIGSCSPAINTILLNDILEVAKFDRAIMKIDIQGFEHRAFVHAEKLLQKIDIIYIFMEWLMLKEYYVSENHTSNDKYIVEEMISLLFRNHYRPFKISYDGGGPLDPNVWHTWPHDIVWHKMPNAAEYRLLVRNHFLNWPH